jgi:Xaa-Pro dipeptidase
MATVCRPSMFAKVAYITDMSGKSLTDLRWIEIAERQSFVASLLVEINADQLLLLEPANLAWFAGTPLARGALDPTEQPALVVSAHQRWVVSSNVDSQRLFDNFLDNLGFQLKEWPWHIGREQLLADLCDNKRLCCDRLVRDAVSATERLRTARLVHSPLTQNALRQLGRDVAHSLEATGRAAEAGDSEGELAGQVAHRLAHRGVEAIAVDAAADGRDTHDARPLFTDRRCEKSCMVAAVCRRDGLHVAASRTILFGDPAEATAKQIESAGQIAAARVAALTPGLTPESLFSTGQRVAEALHHEHIWHDRPFGHWTGWLPVEATLMPNGQQTLSLGETLTLSSRVGTGSFLDTFLITDSGSERITRDEEGPVRRYRAGGRIIELPDVLRR